MLKGYYARECRMNSMYCSILHRMSSDEDNDPLILAVINYLMLDTYKNVTVLAEMLSRIENRSVVYTTLEADRSISMNHTGGDVLDLLSSILRIEKDMSKSIVHDFNEDGSDSSVGHLYDDYEYSQYSITVDGNSDKLKSYIKSVLRYISIDIEERLSILSSLTRAVHATTFCACGYELPRIVSIDLQQEGCTCSSRSMSSKGRMVMLTVHCPRCGRAYHSMVEGSVCDGREAGRDLHCYS